MQGDITKFDFKNPEHKLRILDIDLNIRDVFVEEEFHREVEEIDKHLQVLSVLSEQGKEKLACGIDAHAEKNSSNIYTVSLAWMKQMFDLISVEKSEFFTGIDVAKEFGVSRFVGDKMNHLHRLLSKDSINLAGLGNGAYLIHSEVKDSRGNAIGFEHRFRATNPQEAEKLYEEIASRLSGVLLKVWLACWKLATQVQQYTFSCKLTDLMEITYPGRKGYFSVREKVEFYESLKSLEHTKFIFSSLQRPGKRKKSYFKQYELPFLVITERLISEGNRYPTHISISILSCQPHQALGKFAFRGAAFKNATLELSASDTHLATWIQNRKNQRWQASSIRIPLSDLLLLAGLHGTAESNLAHAKKLLREKLSRLAQCQIILSVPILPAKAGEQVFLKVR